MLRVDNKIQIPDNILLTPLWYNNSLQIPIKREWLDKGIYTVGDIPECNRQPMTIEDFEET